MAPGRFICGNHSTMMEIVDTPIGAVGTFLFQTSHLRQPEIAILKQNLEKIEKPKFVILKVKMKKKYKRAVNYLFFHIMKRLPKLPHGRR